MWCVKKELEIEFTKRTDQWNKKLKRAISETTVKNDDETEKH